MQEDHGGWDEPQEAGARAPHPDAKDSPEQADPPTGGSPGDRLAGDPSAHASLAEGSLGGTADAGGGQAGTADAGGTARTAGTARTGGTGGGQAGTTQPAGADEAPAEDPGARDPGASWVPGPADPAAGGTGSWTAPGNDGQADGQRQAGTPGPWATPPAYGQAGAPGPWATPPAYGQAGTSGPWSILPSAGEPGAEGQNWAGPAGGYGQGGQGAWGPPPPMPPGGYGQGGGYSEPPRRRRTGRFLIYALVAVLAAGAGAIAAALVVPGGSSSTSRGVSAQQIPSPNSNSPSGSTSTINVSAVAAKVEPGVVDIVSRLHYTGQVFEGTGMVLSSSGLVVTNNHVVAGTTHLTATIVTTGRRYAATVVGTDAADDVALIKLQGASGLKTVTVGNSAKVTLGTPVVAIGNAGGRGGLPTVTSGTITSLHRTITATDAGSSTSETLHNVLQTNAPIAEGDSGGPLANASGQVIGMNTAANTQTIGGPGTGQGFAIPINRALSIARQIAAGHGNANIRIGLPAFMGVQVARLPAGSSGTPQAQLQQLEQQASQNGGGINSSLGCLPSATGSPVPASIAPASSGTLIASVFCNDPAAAAGLRAGDVITAVNGQTVTTPTSLTKILSHYKPENTVSVTWIDTTGQHHTGSLKLTSGPAK